MIAVTFNSGGRTDLETLPTARFLQPFLGIARAGRWELPSIAPIRQSPTVETAPIDGGTKFIVECDGAPIIAAAVAWHTSVAQELWSEHCGLYATLFQKQRDSLDTDVLNANANVAHEWESIRSNTPPYPPPMPKTLPWVATIIYPNVHMQLKMGILNESELQIILVSTSVYAKAIQVNA